MNPSQRRASIAPVGSFKVASAVALQMVGAGCTLAVALVISQFLGLVAQGRFGLLKSWTDMLVILLTFGLPQGLLHLAYLSDTPMSALRHIAQRYAFTLLFAVGAPAAAVLAWRGYGEWALVALSVPGFVFHGLLRALLLRSSGVVVYALVSITPAIAVFIGVILLALTRSDRWEWAIAAASAVSVVAAQWIGNRAGLAKGDAHHAVSAEMSRVLWKASAQGFLFSVCMAAQPALLLSLAVLLGAPSSSIGEIAFSIYFLQFFAVFAGFLAPAIYDRYAQGNGIALWWKQDRYRILRLVILTSAALAIFIAMLPLSFAQFLPKSYQGALLPCMVMTLAGATLMGNRLIATLLQATGKLTEMAAQAAVRLVLSLAGTFALQTGMKLGATISIAIAVLSSEVVVVVLSALVLRASINAASAHREPVGRRPW